MREIEPNEVDQRKSSILQQFVTSLINNNNNDNDNNNNNSNNNVAKFIVCLVVPHVTIRTYR